MPYYDKHDIYHQDVLSSVDQPSLSTSFLVFLMASETGFKVLPSGAGYGIVIGIGGVFALLMLFITWLQNRYVGPPS